MARGILILQPGIEPALPVSKAWNLSHWTTRKVLFFFFLVTLVAGTFTGTPVLTLSVLRGW